MATRCPQTTIRLVAMAMGCGLAFLAGIELAIANDQPSEAQILNALKSRGPARTLAPHSLTDQDAVRDDRQFIDTLLKKPLRSVTPDDRRRVLDIVSDKPQIDLDITFEYNSANITPQALPILQSLGRALADKDLNEATFLIGGHTDGAGSDAYNQGLSERRAEAVKAFLMEHFKLSPAQLLAIGFGKSHFRNPVSPLAPENRRVQIVNTELN